MNFLQRLFGSTPTETVSQDVLQNIVVNENLFRTDEDPVTVVESRTVNAKPALHEILNRNFEKMGFEEGYQIHRVDQMSNRLESIAAEFRQIYRKEKQALDALILNLDSYLTEQVKEMMPEEYSRIQNQRDAGELQRIALQAELDLAKSGEGYCEKAVADYRMGFKQGFGLFTDEKLFTERFLLP